MSAITTLEYAAQSGWGWNVHLLRLPSGWLFVYSPAWLGDDGLAPDLVERIKSIASERLG